MRTSHLQYLYPSMKKCLLVLFACTTTVWFSGCAVYMPIQCAAPQITDKNQTELTGSNYFNSRLEGAVAYSPVRHLLVRAVYSGLLANSKSTDSTTYYQGR